MCISLVSGVPKVLQTRLQKEELRRHFGMEIAVGCGVWCGETARALKGTR